MTWLQAHSTILRHFLPPIVCPGCGGSVKKLFADHHTIGRVNYQNRGESILFCDGSEYPS